MIPESNEKMIDEKFKKIIDIGDKLASTNEDNKLTDKDVEDMSKLFNEANISGQPKKFDELTKEEQDTIIESGAEPVLVNETINPITGIRTTTPIDSEEQMDELSEEPSESEKRLNEKLDKLFNMNIPEIKSDVGIDPILAKEYLKENFDGVDIPEEEMNKFLILLDRYRKNEKFSYYNECPTNIKKNIDIIMSTGGFDVSMKREVRNYIVEQMFETILQNNYADAAFNTLTEYTNNAMDEINKELLSPEFSSMRIKNRNMIETFLDKADEVQETNPEAAEKLRVFYHNFHEAYTYNEMMNMYKTKTGKLRAKKIELEKFERACDMFCHRYEKTKFKVYDIKMVLPTLVRHLTNIDEEYIKRFIIAFIKYTSNFNIENVEKDYTFIYYFIRHILDIDHIDEHNEEDKTFCDAVLENINNAINDIIIIETELLTKNNK